MFKKNILNKNGGWVKEKVNDNAPRAQNIQIMLSITKNVDELPLSLKT